VAELGTRCGLITPFTSYYVPSARELRESGELSDAGSPAMPGWAAQALARATPPLLAPLALTGCWGRLEEQAAPAPVDIPDRFSRLETPTEPAAAPAAEHEQRALTAEPQEPPPPPADPAPATDDEGGRGRRHIGEEGTLGPVDQLNAQGTPGAAGGSVGDGTISLSTTPLGGEAAASGYAQPGASSSTAAPAPGPGFEADRNVGENARAEIDGRGDFHADMPATRAPAKAAARPQREIALEHRETTGEDSSEVVPDDVAAWSTLRISGGGGRGGSGENLYGVALPGGQTSVTVTHTNITTVTSWTQTMHRPRRCSDAAGVSLSDRQALWEERLAREDSVAGWVRIYRDAVGKCEAPTWRDRQALLGLMLARAGSVDRMIALYQAMGGAGAGAFLRSAILRRVRTPDELRAVRDAFGLSGAVDWTLIEQVLARAPDDAARLRLLRELCAQYPGNAELKLRLLAGLERAGRLPEARRLASLLRNDPMSDAGVRTAVGEMYLRLGEEPEARRVFSEIVEFAPHDAAARRRLGDLYRAHGWHEEAYRQYQTLAAIRPDDRSVDLLLAQAAAGAGRVDEAIRLEQSLAETAEPGAAGGLARVAVLWTSVRLAKLRREAREAGDEERLRALMARVRRSGVLRGSGALRVALTWSHPDAGLSLWAGHPGLGLTRPVDIAPEYGIEVFEVTEQEGGVYRLEVRRSGGELRTPITAELVVLWNEGQADEQVIVVPLRFEGETRTLAWTIEARALNEAQPGSATVPRDRRPAVTLP
jgi:tetratricopeptide (TPR) repeat protein